MNFLYLGTDLPRKTNCSKEKCNAEVWKIGKSDCSKRTDKKRELRRDFDGRGKRGRWKEKLA